MVENAKGFANTNDFFKKVYDKTGEDYWDFAQQFFYSPKQPKLEYYQTDNKFYFRWNDVKENFIMPIDLLVNGKEMRVKPNKEFQFFEISKHSQVEVMDWKYYVLPSKVK